MDILRLVTIHPILVHATLGGIPLMLLAYALAARRRSTEWLFAGDFLLFATALVTIATGLFGFIAFFVIDWPGGLDLWRWLHLGLGVATAAVLWIMALARAVARRSHQHGASAAAGEGHQRGALEHAHEPTTDRSMRELSQTLAASARELGTAARQQDLARVSDALDRVEATCVSCHLEHRWRDQSDLRAER